MYATMRGSFFFLSNESRPNEKKNALETCHGENADKESDISTGQHDAVCGRFQTVFLLPSGPYADGQDEDVENGHGHDPFDVDNHARAFAATLSRRKIDDLERCLLSDKNNLGHVLLAGALDESQRPAVDCRVLASTYYYYSGPHVLDVAPSRRLVGNCAHVAKLRMSNNRRRDPRNQQSTRVY